MTPPKTSAPDVDQPRIVRPRSFVRMFKPQFAELVASGVKCQTVRLMPKRIPKAGDMISLRCWEGKPYRSKQRVLCEATIAAVQTINITPEGWVWLNDFRIKSRAAFEAFAVADGFATPEDFLNWFRDQHGLPFAGIVLSWTNDQAQRPGDQNA